MSYARFRRARKQEQEPPALQADALLDDAHHAYVHELVMSARLDDIPLRQWLAPLEVVAMERMEAERTP